jgi:hypothetical protein
MMVIKELMNLNCFSSKESIYVAPAGGAAERFVDGIREKRPDVDVSGFLDSFKSGGEVTRVDQVDETQKEKRVVVVIEKAAIRKCLVDTLQQNGFTDLCWVGTNFSLCVEDEMEEDALYLFYDLSVNTLNFEFLYSLARMDIERRKAGKQRVHVVIVPQKKGSLFDFSRQSMERINQNAPLESDNDWFMHNVVIPSVVLMPACSGITLCGSRREARNLAENYSNSRFPQQYDVDNPVELDSVLRVLDQGEYFGYGQPFVSSQSAVGFVRQWLDANGVLQDKCVVITLRDYGLERDRNSDLDVWKCFAQHIKKMGYVPIFVKDTYSDFRQDTLNEYLVFHVASWNIQIRMALYEEAYLNMTVNTGPYLLCMFNEKVRYLNFFHVSQQSYSGNEAYHTSMGTSVGTQYPAHTPFQKWVWGGSDDCELILAEFKIMCECIEYKG